MPVLRQFERGVGEWLSAFELASDSAVRLLQSDYPELVGRLPAGTEDRILVEIGAANDQAEELMLSVLQLLDDRGLMADSVLGSPAGLWQVRHTIPLITEQMDPVVSFDIAVPRSSLHAARDLLRLRVRDIEPDVAPIDLGHVGDGGLHFILPVREATARNPATMAELRQVVFDTVVREFGGTFSAEHGVGRKNLNAYERYVPPEVQTLEDVLKRHMDPNHVLE
jgi:FAD/FMN-containing dehydrogenase